MKNRFTLSPIQQNIVSIIVLLLLTLLFFWRVPLQGCVLLPLDTLYTYEPWRGEVPGALGVQVWNPWLSDGIRYYYPLLNFVQSSLRQQELPFWNPHAVAGMPVLASGLNQVFYPPTVFLLLMLPTAQAMSWATILHAFWGSLFCFLFIREVGAGHIGALLGGVTFVFGALVYWLPALPTFQAIIWLPLLFWAVERGLGRKNWRWAIVGGLVLCLQILAGNIQMTYYSLTGLGLYALYRCWLAWRDGRSFLAGLRPLIFLALMLCVGLGLAALQLLPTFELVPYGARGQVDFNPEFSWKILGRLFVPDILGTDPDRNLAPGFAHELYLYFGLLPLLGLVAAAVSPYRRLAWFLLSLGLLVWFVIFHVPPFYQLFDLLYPSFRVLSFHRAQILIAFAWAAAAGLGFDWLYAQRPPFLSRLIGLGAALLAIMIACALGLAFISKYQARTLWNLPELETEPAAVYLLSSFLISAAILAAGLALLWAWQQNKLARSAFGTIALALVVFDLFLVHVDYTTAVEPDMLYPSTPSLSYMQKLVAQETQPYRLMSVEHLFWGNSATVFGLSDIQGYDPFLMKRYSDYINLTGARLETNHRIAAFGLRPSRLLDALNVKYYYTPRYHLAEGNGVSLLSEVNDPVVESEHISGEQVGEWTIAGWPQKVLLAPPSSKISYQGFLQYPTQLETAIAVDPETWDQPGVDVLFEVYVNSTGLLTDTLLFSQHLTQTQPDAMRWTPVVVDLSDFTDQDVTLSLVTSSPKPEGAWSAGWADPVLMDSSKVELIYYGPNSIYLNKNHLPRAWVVHQVTSVAEKDFKAVESILSGQGFNPAKEAVIEGELSGPLSPEDKPEPVEFITYTPSSVKLKTELTAPGLLVLSDIYYPGWKVYVDGVENPLYATNLMMRGVYVPDGLHQVEFIYDSIGFRIGMYISLATLILVCPWLILEWRLRSRIQRKVAIAQ